MPAAQIRRRRLTWSVESVSDRKGRAVPASRWDNLEALSRPSGDRQSSGSGGSAGGPPRGPGNGRRTGGRGPKLRRLLLIVVGGLVTVALVCSFFGWRFVSQLVSKNAQEVQNLTPSQAGEATNFLLVGSDTRAGLSRAELNRVGTKEVSGQRTDTIILVHVSPRYQKAVMMSIPRDLKVDIPGHGANKINAAYAFGGPALLVKTIEQNFHIPVNHYAEIDFAGFLKVVDAVNGVRLCNQSGHRLDDSFANLHMAPGCQEMNGVQALAFVRARHVDSDFGRIGRQQQFLRAVMDKIASTGNLVNVPKLVNIADIVSDHTKTDDTLTTGEAISLVRRVGKLDGSSVDMRVYPSYPAPLDPTNGVSYVKALPEAPLLTRALADDDPRLPPVGLPGGKGVGLSSMRLSVLNGTTQQGAAGRAAESLRTYGLRIVGTGNARREIGARSTLTFPSSLSQQANLLGSLLGSQVRLVQSNDPSLAGQLTLTIGSSFQIPAPPG
jgi:LCP family protein required for cell wall assembly